MALATRGQIVESLRRLQLLEQHQLDALGRTVDCGEDIRALARALLRRGWLTVFQVNQLLQNRGDDLVMGPYVLLERLGEGGMGRVFKARHRTLHREVALKVIRKEALTNPHAVPRFEREVQAAARLEHPNVVRAFDAGQAAGTYYMAMEFVEGTDLYQLVRTSGPLPAARSCEYMRQAALGLQHAHENGLIHRDIKPANLVITRTRKPSRGGSSALLPRPLLDHYPWGVVKILDFGLARFDAALHAPGQAALTQFGSVMGTPDYLAPEQAWCSHSIDIRADLYSLGCTFYFLLTARPPFPNGTLPEKLIQHRSEEPLPLDQARCEQLLASGQGPPTAGLPSRVVGVVRKLMAKKPEHRFQTPLEMAEALGEMLVVKKRNLAADLRR